MKNKIRCLFEKINKFFHSEQFFDNVLPLITVAVVTFSVVSFSLLSLLSASAAESDGYVTINLSNPNNVPFNNDFYVGNTDNTELSVGFNQVPVSSFESTAIYNVVDGDLIVDGASFPVNVPDGRYLWVQVVTNVYDGYNHLVVDDYYYSFTVDGYSVYFANTVDLSIVEGDYEENYVDFVIVFVQLSDGSSTTQCPTLEEQIAQYSGSWVQFINMVRQNNPTLGNSYQNVVNEAIVAGKISVQGDFIHFSGTYDELLQLLMTTSNNNPNIQVALDKELQRQFENGVAGGYDDGYSDGKDYGQEIGYKNGYNIGLNKGQSDNALKGFFGNFIGGVIDVVDSIHFYEEFDSNGKLTFYLSPWSIVIVVLMVAIVIIFLKVFRGG